MTDMYPLYLKLERIKNASTRMVECLMPVLNLRLELSQKKEFMASQTRKLIKDSKVMLSKTKRIDIRSWVLFLRHYKRLP